MLTPDPLSPGMPSASSGRRRWVRALAAGALLPALIAAPRALRASAAPVRVAVDAEFGLKDSTSAQAIALGLQVAMAQINASGGVLGGRPLELIQRDNHSMPARALANLRELAGVPDLVAVFGGRFSPVMLEAVPLVHELGLPLLAVWSSADTIVDNQRRPNYVFRLGLRDGLAMPALLRSASARGLERVGLLLVKTGWGRSNLAAAQRHVQQAGRTSLVGVAWHHWGEPSLVQRYEKLLDDGAQAVVVVSNDDDAAALVREIAALPPRRRLPLLFHQGISGARFVEMCGPALAQVDLSVLQSFSFFRAAPAPRERFLATARVVVGLTRFEDIEAPTGVAQSYDLMHILARAIDRAGSTQRAAVRDALERVPRHEGLIRSYRPPFTPERHEALDADQLLMARYRADGVLVPA
jgi:branched-chain amino acid transport system substrate-binding protein